jgi:hypothetical protein
LRIDETDQVLEVGSFVVTFRDECDFMWRRAYHSEKISRPVEDDVVFPEGWRVSKIGKKTPLKQFKTVCQIVSIQFSDKVDCSARRQSVAAPNISMEAVVYVRPSDVGELRKCAYEVIETNQGDSLFCNCLIFLPFL